MDIDFAELRVRAGRGTVVWLEGTSHSDEWIYTRWFPGLAGSMLFRAAGGWPSVTEAVGSVRAEAPDIRCFGIIDRDFADASEAFDPARPLLPQGGVVRTPWYTIENYLLCASCWHRIVADARRGDVPSAWQTQAQVADHIARAYREVLAAAAYNAAIHHVSRAQAHPEFAPAYLRDHRALGDDGEAAIQRLRVWGDQMGSPECPVRAYERCRARFGALPPGRWPEVVSGKLVLRHLHRSLPPARGGQMGIEPYVTLYLSVCPDPPKELRALVDAIAAAPA